MVRRWVALWAGALFFLAGCLREDTKPQWDVDLVGPLVHSTFTISDIVPDSMMGTDASGLITLVYSDELFGMDLDTLIDVPDTNFTYEYGIAFGSISLGPGAMLPASSEETSLDVDEVQLRYLELREGTLTLQLQNEIPSGVIGTFSLPAAYYLGVPVSVQQFVGSGTPSVPASATVVRDLSFHQFDLTGPTYDEVNTLTTDISFQLDPLGTGATIDSSNDVRAIATYSGLRPQYARGYFGQRTVHVGPETNEFHLFDMVIAGTIDLDQVEMDLKVTNGIGIDARVSIDHLTASRSATGTSLDLEHAIIPGPINLNRALDLGGSFQPSVYQNDLDNSDSNIDLMLELMPDMVEFELDMEVNPLGDISNGNDFLYWNSTLNAALELRVPLNIIATDLTLQQTQTPELPGSAEGHGIQYGTLKLFAVNGFPFDAALLLDIVDAGGNVLASPAVSGTIASGSLGPDLHVQTPVASELSTWLSAENVDLLYSEGARVRSTIVFNTADQTQHLEILDSYELDLRIVFDGNYVVNGDE